MCKGVKITRIKTIFQRLKISYLNIVLKLVKLKNSKILLNIRVKIENVNCFIKKYERIILRKDIKLKYFMSFVYIGCLINNNKNINNKNIKINN